MKRIIVRLLLAAALILQGIAGAFAETAQQSGHGPCCPYAAQAEQAHHAQCPCPQKQRCASDCQLMCASAATPTPMPPDLFGFEPQLSSLAWLNSDDSLLPPPNDSPPNRPPIV